MVGQFDVPKGRQFENSLAAPTTPSAKPEQIVRPFQAFRDRRDQRIAQLRAAPGEVVTAELCWGEAPQLQESTNNPPDGGGFTTVPSDEPEPEPDPIKLLTFTEYDRKVKKVRVENPDDDSQYVIVEDVVEWYAKGPAEAPFNGNNFKFVIKERRR